MKQKPGANWTNRRRIMRLAAIVTAALLPPTLLWAAAESSGTITEPPKWALTGRLLIAAPDMPVAKYRNLVVVVIENGPLGTMGVAINRYSGAQPWADFLIAMGYQVGPDDAQGAGSFPMYSGGPAHPERLYVLHSDDYIEPGSQLLSGG